MCIYILHSVNEKSIQFEANLFILVTPAQLVGTLFPFLPTPLMLPVPMDSTMPLPARALMLPTASSSAEVMLPLRIVEIVWRMPVQRYYCSVQGYKRPLFGMISLCYITQTGLSSLEWKKSPCCNFTIRSMSQIQVHSMS